MILVGEDDAHHRTEQLPCVSERVMPHFVGARAQDLPLVHQLQCVGKYYSCRAAQTRDIADRDLEFALKKYLGRQGVSVQIGTKRDVLEEERRYREK